MRSERNKSSPKLLYRDDSGVLIPVRFVGERCLPDGNVEVTVQETMTFLRRKYSHLESEMKRRLVKGD